ncbi:MAG: tRNA glutamyl-Q(34) synthetase GluQRS [Planctomycetes bacterium]|nr:tRNA glutamyl-Q(34) synthetase GluQRS [Planctomycetota bacterium]
MSSTSAAPRGRIAPSPTGALHLGNLRTFALAWLSLRSRGGTVVLRIEDLDGPRVKPRAAAQLISDLRWLGFDWEEGPDVGGARGPYVQTERRALYAAALDHLRALGTVYPCVCSRREIEAALSAPNGPADEGARYPGTCAGRYADEAVARAAAGGREIAWRFRAPHEELQWQDLVRGLSAHDVQAGVGDFVVWRGDCAYQLAVVVDDAAMAIDEVLRGDDLFTSTARQLLLYRALGLRAPRFAHVPLVVGSDGRRLAKRHGDTRIARYREAGIAPERLIGWVAETCGFAPTGAELSLRDLLPRFALEAVPRERVVLDEREHESWFR